MGHWVASPLQCKLCLILVVAGQERVGRSDRGGDHQKYRFLQPCESPCSFRSMRRTWQGSLPCWAMPKADSYLTPFRCIPAKYQTHAYFSAGRIHQVMPSVSANVTACPKAGKHQKTSSPHLTWRLITSFPLRTSTLGITWCDVCQPNLRFEAREGFLFSSQAAAKGGVIQGGVYKRKRMQTNVCKRRQTQISGSANKRKMISPEYRRANGRSTAVWTGREVRNKHEVCCNTNRMLGQSFHFLSVQTEKIFAVQVGGVPQYKLEVFCCTLSSKNSKGLGSQTIPWLTHPREHPHKWNSCHKQFWSAFFCLLPADSTLS